jgi:protein-tyrosine phosphatase
MSAAPLDFERLLPLDGSFNFRDLGGYPTSDGRYVKPGRLYRADGPHALTDGDRRALRALGLATVIDLRTPDEAAERCSYAEHVDGVTLVALPLADVLPDPDELPTWVEPAVVARRYREMLDNGLPAVAQALRVLTTGDALPAVMHCSAGKDRTGILSAIVLGMVGVPDDAIIADYALSGSAMTRFIDFLITSYPDAGERLTKLAPALVAAEPETIRRFLSNVRAEYGSFDDFAVTIGVSDAPRQLRGALVTPSA